jgi:hypothetical protein
MVRKPQGCGCESQTKLKKTSMKDIANEYKTSWIDSSHKVVSNCNWHTMWFLMVEELCPLKYESLRYGQEAPDLRSRSYKLALKSSKGETFVANKKLQDGSRSSKEVNFRGKMK